MMKGEDRFGCDIRNERSSPWPKKTNTEMEEKTVFCLKHLN